MTDQPLGTAHMSGDLYSEKNGKGELKKNWSKLTVGLKHVNITRQLESLTHFVYPDLDQFSRLKLTDTYNTELQH